MKKNLLYIIIGSCLFCTACVSNQSLFETYIDDRVEGQINDYKAVNVFSDYISNEVWNSKEGNCLKVTQSNDAYAGEGSLHVEWDKQGPECTWLGLGFGWENWTGKNLSQIYDHAAIQFKVKAVNKDISNLPLALCLEDYSGSQAWTGFSKKMLDKEIISTTEWNTVSIPILNFNWAEFEADISNIKQLLIQFEASGNILIDEIKIVEHIGTLDNRAFMLLDKAGSLNLDNFEFHKYAPAIEFDDHEIFLASNSHNLYIMANVKDDSPLANAQENENIWNGDAIEIAISTNLEASKGRNYYLASDRQYGIKMASDPMIYSWKEGKRLSGQNVEVIAIENQVSVRAKIPLAELGIDGFKLGGLYDLEIAIDQGNETGREHQTRWNSPDIEGFHNNPSLWGELKIIELENNEF